MLGLKSSTDATSNEVMEADDDKVEQKLRLNLSLLFNLIYKAITGVKIIFYSNFKYDYDYVVPMYRPSCFPIPDAQHNKYSFGVNITTHFGQEYQNVLSNRSFNSLSSLLSSSAASRTHSGSKR